MKLANWLVAGACAGTLLVSGMVLAGVPKGKEKITIDRIAGKKGAVTFEHAKHADEFKDAAGGKMVCKTCHHTLDKDVPADASAAKACNDCHVKDGEAKKKTGDKEAPVLATMKGDAADMKSVIFHKTCLDNCHKKQADKEKGKCTTCHAK